MCVIHLSVRTERTVHVRIEIFKNYKSCVISSKNVSERTPSQRLKSAFYILIRINLELILMFNRIESVDCCGLQQCFLFAKKKIIQVNSGLENG